MSKTQVRPTSRGQVTLPIIIRKKLNVGPDTLLDVSIEGKNIVLRPIDLTAKTTRFYSSDEIDEFLNTDKLSPENATFFKQLLKQRG